MLLRLRNVREFDGASQNETDTELGVALQRVCPTSLHNPRYVPLANWPAMKCDGQYALSDALDGKHARRIGACSPVGEILDHSIDTWRLTAPALTCFYSLFGRLEYGLAGHRMMRLLLATQSVVAVMFWQQYVTGVLVYSWGYDIMQYVRLIPHLMHNFGCP